MKTLSAIILATGVALAGTTLHVVATPCQTEDSVMCYWNADARGNGQGTSYIAVSDTLSLRTK